MARSSIIPSKIYSKQPFNQSSGSTISTRGKDINPDTSNVISNWNSSKLFLERSKI